MPTLLETVTTHSTTILASLCGVAIVWLAWLIVLSFRVRRLERFRRNAEAATDTAQGAELLAALSHAIGELSRRVSRAETQLDHSTRVLQGCLQHIGLVRYDAFEDVGGQQSFSLAMLDGGRNGIVITAIYSRTDVRLYTKHIEGGRASGPLTPEETSAVKQALTGLQG